MSQQSSKIDFDLGGIGALIDTTRLAVPIYQRSYSWGPTEVEDYWNDLSNALTSPDPEYFLGTIVMSREGAGDGRVSIVDGQQRIATTAILYAAIRDEYSSRSDKSRATIIRNKYLSDADLASGLNVPKLRLNSEDDEFFRKLVVEGDTHEVAHESHKLIFDAHASLRERVSEVAASAGAGWADVLLKWSDFVRDRVRVVTVIVPTESDAFLIFETLNDRGADLTIADLLKNYLFGRAGNRIDVVRNNWLLALGALEMSAENSLFTTFLRQYWSSRRGATRERDLYKDIKTNIVNENQAVELSEELVKGARLYAALLVADHDFWTEMGTTAKVNVETLLRLELEQIRPLLLAAMQHFGTQELKRLLRAAVSWGVRGLIVGGIGGGTYERKYCDVAVKIRNGEVKSQEDVFKELSSIIPSDDEFKTAFAVARVPRGQLARHYLSALEREKQGQAEPELVPNENEEQVNLEHILPKSPTDTDWPQFTGDEKKDFLHRVGNLALLQKGPNGKIGNKPFSVKKPILSASALVITREAGAKSDWTPTVIAERQKELADLAVTVWPRITT